MNDTRPRDPAYGALLLISADIPLHRTLRGIAHAKGRMVVRIDTPTAVAPVVHAVAPSAVLLDLDLPGHSAWQAGETLLREQTCPPVVLLSAPKDQFDLRTAMRAGSLLDKTQSPARLLELIDEVLAMPDPAHSQRNAIQRVLLRWLNPAGWTLPSSQRQHFHRLNE